MKKKKLILILLGTILLLILTRHIIIYYGENTDIIIYEEDLTFYDYEGELLNYSDEYEKSLSNIESLLSKLTTTDDKGIILLPEYNNFKYYDEYSVFLSEINRFVEMHKDYYQIDDDKKSINYKEDGLNYEIKSIDTMPLDEWTNIIKNSEFLKDHEYYISYIRESYQSLDSLSYYRYYITSLLPFNIKGEIKDTYILNLKIEYETVKLIENIIETIDFEIN